MSPPVAPAPDAGPVARFGTLLVLINRARQTASAEELAFLAVNETHQLTPYRQGVVWSAHPAGGRVAAISGQPLPDRNAPYAIWQSTLLAHLASREKAAPLPVTREDLPETLAAPWEEWLPERGLWLPWTVGDDQGSGGHLVGGLFLARERAWGAEERALLSGLCAVYALAWRSFSPAAGFWRRLRDRLGGRPFHALLLVLTMMMLAIPVRQSVLAPAEVVAAQPAVIRAPLEGVVDRFHVQPNELVMAGQPLLSLDGVRLANQLAVARKEWESAGAAYRQAAQRAVRDSEGKTRLTLLKKRWEQKAADVDYLQGRLQRLEIRAPRDGIAIFADANDWIGRPVALGERILMLADPDQVALEIHLPVADAINLEIGAEVAMFLNIHPGRPLSAALTYASYQAEVMDEGILAYRLKADFTGGGGSPPRIGLRGTARLYHQRVSLFHLLSRRPLAAVRQWLGW